MSVIHERTIRSGSLHVKEMDADEVQPQSPHMADIDGYLPINVKAIASSALVLARTRKHVVYAESRRLIY